jgi:predicted NBD/HSP70 family sugar kinase
MLALAEGGDAGVQRAITDAGGVVGRAVADLCNYVNPELVVVGGDLAAAGDLLLEPIRDAVRRYAIPAAADELRILPAGLGPRAEVLGALALAGHESDELLTISMSPTSYQRRRTR